MKNPAYVLGHSGFELARLARQERLIGKITREYFRNAGIDPIRSGRAFIRALLRVGTASSLVWA